MARTVITSPNPYTFNGIGGGTAVSSFDGTNWAEQNGVNGQLVGEATTGSGSWRNDFGNPSDCQWKTGTFSADQYAQITVLGTWTGSDADYIGVNLRNNGGSGSANISLYRAVWVIASSAARIIKLTNANSGASGTQVGSDVSMTLVSGNKFSCQVVTSGGSAVFTFYKDTGSGPVQQGSTVTDASSPHTSGKPGISGKNSANLIFGDDFVAGDITAASGGFLARNYWWDNL